MNRRELLEQQIENIFVAQAMMKDLPEKVLVRHLECWRLNNKGQSDNEISTKDLLEHRCGSTACFGGWVAIHPHFQKQGVRPSKYGSPCIRSKNLFEMSDVASELFGNSYMFSPNYFGSDNDKEEIENRLKDALRDVLYALSKLEAT